jgi:glutathione S-transferase
VYGVCTGVYSTLLPLLLECTRTHLLPTYPTFTLLHSGVLVRKEDSERKEHFQKLIAGLTSFSTELRKTSGATFLAEHQLSNVDLALVAYRFYVFETYRGPDFAIPLTKELEPYHEWYDYVMNLESVKKTLPGKERYLEHIKKYADGSARSKVANAVRRGVTAHEIDDEKDDY